jgi:hypothetical protein
MQCNRCESKNVDVIESGPHKKLVCQDCYSFIKFLSAAEYKIFLSLKAKREEKANGDQGVPW